MPSARFNQRDYLQTLSTSSPKPPLCPAPSTHPAWWGFASAQNRDKIEALISRMKCKRFLHPEHPSADGIADKALFSAICMNPNHVFSSFLPRPKQHQYQHGMISPLSCVPC